jgi:hypothetical protein
MSVGWVEALRNPTHDVGKTKIISTTKISKIRDFQKIKSSNYILTNTITRRMGRPHPYNIGEFISWCSLKPENIRFKFF